MGGKVPFKIRRQVLRQWLDGDSRDQIAKDNGIGEGTVSAIVKEAKKYEFEQGYRKYNNDYEDDNDGSNSVFDLMRQVAVKLKNHGITIESLASTVRLKERIRNILQLPSSSSSLDRTTTTTTTKNGEEVEESMIAIEHDKIECFIEALEVFCFKHNKSVKEFVDLVYRIAFTAYNKFGIPLEYLPDYVRQLESEADTLIEQIEEKKLEMKNVSAYYDHAGTLGYDANRSSVFEENENLREENKKLREQLAKVIKERDMFARDAIEFAISLPEEEDDTSDEPRR